MNHQLVGRPIGKFQAASVEVNGAVAAFGPGSLWDERTLKFVEAIRAGEIEGEVYSDGEVWANPQSLSHYIARQVPA